MADLGPISMITSALPPMSRVLRRVTMSVAASVGLAVDRVEDAALATSEIFAFLTSGRTLDAVSWSAIADSSRLSVTLTPIGAELAWMAPAAGIRW